MGCFTVCNRTSQDGFALLVGQHQIIDEAESRAFDP